MASDLETYLNDHLAGAEGGVRLAKHLADTATGESEKCYFAELEKQISGDRDALMEVIQESGFAKSAVRRVLGGTMVRLGIWRMDMDGMEFGELGRFEMIELLAVGIHGKCLLWRTLRSISEFHPEWNERDFEALERSAVCQSISIEGYRSREAFALFNKSAGDAPI